MAQFINQGVGGNEGLGLGGGNDVVQGPIPLYQNGFNWLRFWLGCCLTLTLCLLLATFITFLVLFILVVSGGIGQGRMMPTITNGVSTDGNIPPTLNKFMDNNKDFVKSFENNMHAIKTQIQNCIAKYETGNKFLKKLIPAV